MAQIFLTIVLLGAHFVLLSAQNRFESHSGLTLGLEVGNYLSLYGTYPSKEPGYSVGFFTGLDVHQGTNDALYLNAGLNYTSITSNRIGVTRIFNNLLPSSLHFTINNEHFRLSFGEVSIGPEYSRSIIGDLVFSLYGNFFVGIGKETLRVLQISQSVIADSTNSSYPTYMYGPYGEYNMDSTRFPYGFTAGFRLIWYSVILDGRFKQTTFDRPSSIMPVPKTIFVSLGYLF